jgi:hypothetical protein
MPMSHPRSSKLYRDGPIPEAKRWSGALCWSCHPTSRHEHRWYLSAWVCWWVTPRPFVRLAAWLLAGLTVVGLGAAWWRPPSPRPPVVAAPLAPAPQPVPLGTPPPLTPQQWACLLQRLQGKPCVPAMEPTP